MGQVSTFVTNFFEKISFGPVSLHLGLAKSRWPTNHFWFFRQTWCAALKTQRVQWRPQSFCGLQKKLHASDRGFSEPESDCHSYI